MLTSEQKHKSRVSIQKVNRDRRREIVLKETLNWRLSMQICRVKRQRYLMDTEGLVDLLRPLFTGISMIRTMCEESSRGHEDQVPPPEAAYTCVDETFIPRRILFETLYELLKSCMFPSAFQRWFFAVHVLHLFFGAEFSVINHLLHCQVVLLWEEARHWCFSTWRWNHAGYQVIGWLEPKVRQGVL